jgi:hypothetical protein
MAPDSRFVHPCTKDLNQQVIDVDRQPQSFPLTEPYPLPLATKELPVHACKEDCKVKKSDAKQRGDNALAMNKKLGVSAGRCPVTLMQHEDPP